MQVHSLTRLVEEFLESSSSGVWYVKNILKQGQLHASKEDGCPAQKISSVQTYFPKMKAGSRMQWAKLSNLWKIVSIGNQGFSQDGCLAPVVTFQRVPRHPWHPHCRRPCSILPSPNVRNPPTPSKIFLKLCIQKQSHKYPGPKVRYKLLHLRIQKMI